MSRKSSGVKGGGDGDDGSSTKWKNPPPAHMEKYGLVPLPETFQPTKEEKMVLEMYSVIQQYEKTAARLKDEAIRAKMAARQAEFQHRVSLKSQEKRKKKKKKAAAAENPAADDDDDMKDDDEDDEDEDAFSDGDDDDGADSSEDEKEAKLAALRREVEEKRAEKTKAEEAEKLREEHLHQAEVDPMEDIMGAQSLKRKRPPAAGTEEDGDPSKLIANLAGAATPPHDFSKKYDLTSLRGKTLFPESIGGPPESNQWRPPKDVYSPNDGAFLVELPDFDVGKASYGQGNNTVGVKFTAPQDSKRFSINIATEDAISDDFNSVLFHFNPRQRGKGAGQLVINDKQTGIWGQAVNIPLSRMPLMFGQVANTLLIQINGDGFDVFLEGEHIARLEHRTELPSGPTTLLLQFPSTDDRGKSENWIVYKVWWGNHKILSKEGDALQNVPGVNSYSGAHPRKLFISGLKKIYSEAEIDIRRAELERVFRRYGGDRGVQCIIPKNSRYAFIEFETERQCDIALAAKELNQMFRLNRARRSKHEVLQEERALKQQQAAAAAAVGGGAAATNAAAAALKKKNRGTDWD